MKGEHANYPSIVARLDWGLWWSIVAIDGVMKQQA